MKLVWHNDRMLEGQWLRAAFGDLVTDEITDLSLNCFDDDSIHVLSTMRVPLSAYDEYFTECRARCKRLVLVHGSDEWFFGYGTYRYFDAVIRMYHTYLAHGEGILTIPLGFPDGTPTGIEPRPISDRQYLWSFAGEIKTSRIEMMNALNGLEPAWSKKTDSIHIPGGFKLSKLQYNDILDNTVFLPCPMGNMVAETWRLYEGIEHGCIPLVERRLTMDYYKSLLGPDHPIPTFKSWEEARPFMEKIRGDNAALTEMQFCIFDWWREYKRKMSADIRALVATSHHRELERFSKQMLNRSPLLHEPIRVAELLRHQSRENLTKRGARTIYRVIRRPR